MEVQIHKDLKTHNTYLLLHQLLLKQSATMSDLVKSTGLSQSSVRNMLRDLEIRGVIKDIGVDHSTGGRCPNRFILDAQKIRTLNIYVHHRSAEYCFMNLYEEVYKGVFNYNSYQELENWIINQTREYVVCCITLAVEGVVDGYIYYTDHKNEYIRNDWIDHLKNTLDIPVYVENDVKAIQRGFYSSDESLSYFTFLYINEVGMACSTMKDGNILSGEKGILGELGLIPYQDKTINQFLRECNDQKEYENMILYLCTIICVSLDPQKIVLADDTQWNIDIDLLDEKLYPIVHSHYDITRIENVQTYLFNGLNALAIHNNLLKISEER
ncbi:MAG: ROK family protein [Coprobacillus sp.]